MTTLNRQTKRLSIWFNRATTSIGDLKYQSDWTLQDIGLSRYRSYLDSCRPFWLA